MPDIIHTYSNGLTFNISAFNRDVAAIIAFHRANPLHPSRPSPASPFEEYPGEADGMGLTDRGFIK